MVIVFALAAGVMAVPAAVAGPTGRRASSVRSRRHPHHRRHRHRGRRKPLGCPPHQSRRHRVCRAKVLVAGKPADPTRLLMRDAKQAVSHARAPRIKRRYRRRVLRPLAHGLPKKARKIPSALLRHALTEAEGTASAQASAASKGGWHLHQSGHVTNDETRIGDQDRAGHVKAAKTVSVHRLRLALENVVAKDSHELVDRCPNADGKVPGDALDRLDLNLTADTGSAKGSVEVRIKIRTWLTGHVNPDGSFRDFDLRMKLTALVESGIVGKGGKLYTAKAPAIYVYEIEADHNTFASVADSRDTTVRILRATAPNHNSLGYLRSGHIHYWDKTAKALSKVAYRYGGTVLVKAARYYRQAEHYWQTPGNCVTVKPAASTTSLKPGQKMPVSVKIAGPPRTGKGLAPGKFTVTASSGSVSPSSGTYKPGHPIKLTYKAPDRGGATGVVTINTTSRQGKGRGAISFTTKADHYELRYTRTSQVDWDFQDSSDPSADYRYQFSQHFAAHANIPLSGDPTRGLVTGSGSDVFDDASLHKVETGTFGGFYGAPDVCTGTETTDLISTNDGTARVLGLRIEGKNVTLDFTPGREANGSINARPDETYRYVADIHRTDGQPDPAGECSSSTNNFESDFFMHDFTDSHVDSDYIFPQSDSTPGHIHVTGGWQPGSGDTLATLTQTATGYEQHGTSTATDTFRIIRTKS